MSEITTVVQLAPETTGLVRAYFCRTVQVGKHGWYELEAVGCLVTTRGMSDTSLLRFHSPCCFSIPPQYVKVVSFGLPPVTGFGLEAVQ